MTKADTRKLCSKLEIGHINIASLQHKLHEILVFLKDSPKLDVIGISETRLSHHDSSVFEISGYTLIRKDAKYVGETGTIMYFRSDLARYTKRREDLETIGVESIWLEFKIPGNKPLLVGTIYRNPNKYLSLSEWHDNVTLMMDKVADQQSDIVMMGDFNINLFAPHTKWLATYESCGLTQLIKEPTRVSNLLNKTTATLIDHIYTNCTEKVLDANVYKSAASDHYLVQCKYTYQDIRHKKHSHSYVDIRSFKKFDKDAFLYDLSKVSFNPVYQYIDPEKALDIWYSLFLPVLDKHAPIRKKRVRQKEIPAHITQDIKNLMRERDKAKQQFGKKDCRYKKLRNRVSEAIKQSRKKQTSESIERNDALVNVWRIMNDITGKSKSSSSHQTKFSPEELNKHFLSLAQKLQTDNTSPNPSYNDLIEFSDSKPRPVFKMPLLTVYEVGKIISNLQSKKSCGADNINANTLKIALPYIVESLTYVFNQCISNNVFPKRLTVAKVVPLPKVKNPSDLSDLRPISLLPVLSKPLEKHMQKHMSNYIEESDLFYQYQSGFRKNHSCQTALIRLCDSWYTAINNSELVGTVFLDLKKAFDLVDHEILLSKIRIYFKDEDTTLFLRSYLNDRAQYVHNEGLSSTLGKIMFGVPQGSILGPLLFCLFINDLPLCLKGLDVVCDIFADDNSIHTHDKNLDVINTNLQEGLNRINDWCIRNKMMLNPAKTKAMILATRQKHQLKPLCLNLSLGNSKIQQVEYHKVLGVIIDQKFTWEHHINHICKTIARNVYLLKLLSNYVKVEHLKIFFFAHCMSHLNYASPIWSGADEVHLKPLNSLHRRAAKIMCKQENLNTDQKLKHLGLLSLNQQHTLNTAITVFKIRRDMQPQYLSQLLTPCSSRYGSLNYIIPRAHMDLFKRSFSFSGPSVWNSLPTSFKPINSLASFKAAVHRYLLYTNS